MSRVGVALPVLLLLVLSLAALSHGVLVLARDALSSVRAWTAVVQGRVAAEVGVRGVKEAVPAETEVLGPPPGLWEARTVLEGDLGPRTRYRVRLRRLGPEFRLLEGEGRVEPEAASSRVARVVWTLDPVARLGAAEAVAEVGGRVGVESGASVSGHGMGLDPDGWPPGACHPYREALDSLFPQGLLAAAAPHSGDRRSRPGLGLLPLDTLLARADVSFGPGGRVSPAPEVEEGTCVPGSSNWGHPGDPTAPCGDRLVLVAGTGSLAVEGGEGQGILAVSGDLRMDGDAHFAGVVLVGGRLEMEDDARIEGIVGVGGDLEVRDGGMVLGRGCSVLRALEAATGLGAPVYPAGGSWLSPL